MPEKSYVGLETHVCLICGKEYDTGTLLFDRRLLPSLKHKNCTGYGFCEEHQKVLDDGYIFLVEVEEEARTDNPTRTGEVIYLKREAADQVFNVPVKNMAYVTRDATSQLKQMVQP